MGRPAGAARAAFVVFVAAGWLPAAWATRIPAIADELDLGSGELALAILGLEGGAIVGLPLGAAAVTRLGSRATLRIAFVVFAVALVAVGSARSFAALTSALAVWAAGNSVVDVAMNVQGAEVERRGDGPLLSRLHAGHPLGLVAGGLTGTALAAAGTSVTVHLALVAVTGLAAVAVASHWAVSDAGPGGQPALVLPNRPLLLVGIVAFCGFALDAVAANWSAVHLRSEHAATPGVAAGAFAAFALAVTLGRMLADRAVARVGRRRAVEGSAGLAGAGIVVVVLAPTAATAILGWAVFGLGVAAIAPTALGAAAASGDAPPPVAIAAVSTIGYLGSFTAAPAIGGLAEATTLTGALVAVVVVCAVLAVLARQAFAAAQPGRPTS